MHARFPNQTIYKSKIVTQMCIKLVTYVPHGGLRIYSIRK